jgi:hypothetical protein
VSTLPAQITHADLLTVTLQCSQPDRDLAADLTAIKSAGAFAAQLGAPEQAQLLDDLCAVWQMPTAATNTYSAIAAPALLLYGGFSTTDEAWAQAAATAFSTATQVRLDNVGAPTLFSGEPCAATIAQAFLADPSTAVDTACAQGLTVPFLTPLSQYVLVEFNDRDAGIRGVHPEGWRNTDGGVYTLAGTQQAIYYRFYPDDGGETISLMSNYYGVRLDEDTAQDVEINGRTWRVYRVAATSNAGYLLVGTTRTIDDYRLLVVVSSDSEEEANLLYQALFLRALEAFVASTGIGA